MLNDLGLPSVWPIADRRISSWLGITKQLFRLLAVPFLCCFVGFVGPQVRAEDWPADASGTNIGAAIGSFNTGFEASGLAYHDSYGFLVVGDDGDVAILRDDGEVSAYQFIGGDFEAIAVKTGKASLAYIASENLNAILEISLPSLTLTGKSWPLQIPQSGGLGFEGLTYVPAHFAPSSWGESCCGGFFVAGTQADSTLRVFDVNTAAETGSALGSVATIPSDYADVSGLHFSSDLAFLYVLHDAANRLTVMTLDGTKIAQYETPTQAAEEGIVVVPDCELETGFLALADDSGPVVMRYGGYVTDCGASTQNNKISPAILWLLMRRVGELEGI